MTNREINWVFPLVNSIVQGQGLKEIGGARKNLLEGLATKCQTVVATIAAKKDELLALYGEPGNNGNFRLRTPEAKAAYRRDLRTFLNADSAQTFTNKETDIFETLILQALLGGYEDFPDV